MKDEIIRALICDGEASLFIAGAGGAVQKCADLLALSEQSTNVMGRMLVAGALLAQRNKDESEKLTVIVSGGGPSGKLLVTASSNGTVKGCIDEPNLCSPAESISALVGSDGTITVVRDNPSGQPYVGVSPLVSGDITRDVAAYIVTSEQQAAAAAFDCQKRKNGFVCGGLIIYALPNCSEKSLQLLEKKANEMSNLLERMEYCLSLEELALDMFWDVGIKVLDSCKFEYHCDCSEQRMAEALVSIGKNELEKLAREQGKIEICCRFCNKKYEFAPNALLGEG